MAKKITAIYARVSSSRQSTRSQRPVLERYVKNNADELGDVKWFVEKHTGKIMDRPKWNKLQTAMDSGRVSRLIVWKLDRLGRTASGLTKLFEELQARKIRFVSLTENIDLGTPSGRMVAVIMASVAAYENEVRAERVMAGQAVARAKGTTWGGSKKGSLYKYTKEQVRQIVKMKKAGKKVSVICRTVGVDRQSVYRILKRVADGDIKV